MNMVRFDFQICEVTMNNQRKTGKKLSYEFKILK